MAFLIPGYVQKSLLRYLLSHAPIDIDTVDLEQFNIKWSKQTTIELRDVGLDVKVGCIFTAF
jgi:hypothetical protein